MHTKFAQAVMHMAFIEEAQNLYSLANIVRMIE
jgi:hypothetical protein